MVIHLGVSVYWTDLPESRSILLKWQSILWFHTRFNKFSIIKSDRLKFFIFFLSNTKTFLEVIFKPVSVRNSSPCWIYMKNVHSVLLGSEHVQAGCLLSGTLRHARTERFLSCKTKIKKCISPFKQDPGKLERRGLCKQPLALVCLLKSL